MDAGQPENGEWRAKQVGCPQNSGLLEQEGEKVAASASWDLGPPAWLMDGAGQSPFNELVLFWKPHGFLEMLLSMYGVHCVSG